MTSDQTLADYYARRAEEYESIYAKPERQVELEKLRKHLRSRFAGEKVLEVACGTGYWTEVISQSAKSVVALDINDEVLEVARRKSFSDVKPHFEIADAYRLPKSRGEFTGGLSAFWWSHVPKARLNQFLAGFHESVGSCSKITFVDNRYVEGSSTVISRIDASGDTFQMRKLKDGSLHEVLKNFPTREELINAVSADAVEISVNLLEYYWLLEYRLK
ncbi:MAG: putative methyltransferase [Verrucomicrobiales bacterium]|nr:putative methyltransferase [Verrucomicrobiales bacterium]